MRRGFGGFMERLPVLAASAVLVLLSGSCGYQQSEQQVPPAGAASARSIEPARVAQIESSLRAIEDELRDSPRDHWDPDFVVRQAGTDPQVLFEWVRDNTFWIPYRGLLRGPVGVLNDRLGNSLDRAVLLATLLQKAGHNVRLAHRELGPKEAFNLAYQAAIASPISPEQPNLADAEVGLEGSSGLDGILIEREQVIDAVISDLDARASDQTQRLLSAIEKTGTADEWAGRFEATVAALRDHWWVQRQNGATWMDLDLLSADEASPAATASETVSLAEIAPRHHEIALRVIAEQWSGGTTTERRVMEHVWRPAETIGQSIVLQFWPSDWRTDDVLAATDPEQNLRAMTLDQQQWGAALTIGDVIVAYAQVTSAGEVVGAQKGGSMGAIAGNFGQSEPQGGGAADPMLSAMWLEYEIRSPDTSPRRIRRQVFDLLGPAERVAGAKTLELTDSLRLTRSLSLTMHTEILPVNCGFATAYVADLAARSLVAGREVLLATARGEIAPGTQHTEQLLKGSVAPLSPLYTLALARLEWSRHAEQIFIDRLNIFARHRFLASANGSLVVREATDIVANEVGVDLAAYDAFAIRVAQGVFDTNAERLLQVSGRPLGNTAAAFEGVTNWITLESRDELGGLDIPQDARQRIAADIAGGYSVVAPPKPVDFGTETFVGWWRIHPDTGDTLGIGETGWGQDMAERGVQYRFFSEMAKQFVFDSLLCQAMPLVTRNAAPMVADFFGTGSAPVQPAQKASQEAYNEVKSTATECMISAIVTGAAFATLPLLLKALRYTMRGAARALPRSMPWLPKWRPKPHGMPRPPRAKLPCLR
jgi:hypothetical protein